MATTDADTKRYLSFQPHPPLPPLPLLTPSILIPHLLPMFLTHLHLSDPSYSYLSASGCSKHTTRQTNTGRDRDRGHDESMPAYFRTTNRRARVATWNMRASHARPKS